MHHLLQSSVFPSIALCGDQDLYFWVNHQSASSFIEMGDTPKILLPQQGRVSTKTYFNSLSIKKWKRETAISNLFLKIFFEGSLIIRFFGHHADMPDRVLFECKTSSSSDQDGVIIEIPELEKIKDEILSFEIYALEKSHLLRFEYVTETAPKNQVRLGISITHFKREEFVIPAVQRIKKYLLDDPRYSDRVKLFVVDNGQTLKAEDVPGAELIPNQNLGGSGGFMRGFMEIENRKEFTHCLFMDDDASCEVESLRRTISILEHANDPTTAIAGSMLKESHTHIQHENGAFFEKYPKPRNHHFDLKNMNLLAINERDQKFDFGGWWYFAFPVAAVKKLTFPFFVRGDDIFFGIHNQFHLCTLNGICSWQSNFLTKESPFVWYLDFRGCAMNILFKYSRDDGYSIIRKKIKKDFHHTIHSYHYQTASAILDTMNDILSGPEFWIKNVNMSKMRNEILKKYTGEKVQLINNSEWHQSYKWKEGEKLSKLAKFFRGGINLLPHYFFRKSNVATRLHSFGSPSISFRRKEVFYFDCESQMGYKVKHDRGKDLILRARYFKLMIRLRLHFSRMMNAYDEKLDFLTSREFWSEQFKK